MRARRLSLLVASLPLPLSLAFAACGPPPEPPAPPPPPPASVSVSAAPAPPPPPETPDDEFRKRPPPVGERRSASPPAVLEARIGNGVRALVVERHDLPLVALSVVVSWGPKPLPPGQARAWTHVFPSVTTQGQAATLRERLEAVAADLAVDPGQDAARLAATCLSGQLDQVLASLGDALARPQFAEKRVVEERESRLQALRLEGPEEHLMSRADELLFAPQHPYRVPVLGDEASVSKLSDKDLARFHEQHVTPDAVTVVAVGDVSKGQLVDKLEKAFGSWKGKAPAAKGSPPDKLAEGVFLLDDKRAPTRVLIALPSPPRASRDRAAVQVLRALLQERLFVRVRERASSAFARPYRWETGRYPGILTVLAQCDPEQAGQVVEGLLDEAAKLGRGEFSEDELTQAKRSIAREIEQQLDRTVDTVWAVSEIAAYDLPPSGLASYADAAQKLSRADVEAAAKSLLRKEAVRVVAQGDAQAMKPGLAKLGLTGKVTVTKAPAAPAKASKPAKK